MDGMQDEIFWLLLFAAAAAAFGGAIAWQRLRAAARGAAKAEACRPSRERVRMVPRPAPAPIPKAKAPERPAAFFGQERPALAVLFSDSGAPLLAAQPARPSELSEFREVPDASVPAGFPFAAALALPREPSLAIPGSEPADPGPAVLEIAFPSGVPEAGEGGEVRAFAPGGLPMGTGRAAAPDLLEALRSLARGAGKPWLPEALRDAAASELNRLKGTARAPSEAFGREWEPARQFLLEALAVPSASDSEAAALLAARCEEGAAGRLAVLAADRDDPDPEKAARSEKELLAILTLWRAALPVLAAGAPAWPAAEHSVRAFLAALKAAKRPGLVSGEAGIEAVPEDAPAVAQPPEWVRAADGAKELAAAIDASLFAMRQPPRIALRAQEGALVLLRLDPSAGLLKSSF